MRGTAERSEQTCRWVQRENGEFTVICQTEKMNMKKRGGTGKGEFF